MATLDHVRPLFKDGPALLRSGGLFLIEVAASRAEKAEALMKGTPGLTDVRILQDLEGFPRVIVARKL